MFGLNELMLAAMSPTLDKIPELADQYARLDCFRWHMQAYVWT